MIDNTDIVELRNITKEFASRSGSRQRFVALNHVNLAIRRGEVMALVGESGSGKTTSGLLIAHLMRATTGDIYYENRPLSHMTSGKSLRRYRKNVQIVFQDPFSSLNPIHTVGYHVMRPLLVHKMTDSAAETHTHILDLLTRVGLTPASYFFDKLPHQLSGGQRQRVNIARALACHPQFLIADEPTSMLDVSLRIDILNLLLDFQREGVTYLYITHDLASAQYVATRIAVLYRGHLVELGGTEEIIHHPEHPYTQQLIQAVQDSALQRVKNLTREDTETRECCAFYLRCPMATEICATEPPSLNEMSSGHWVACHHPL